jgi:hypothetical protein
MELTLYLKPRTQQTRNSLPEGKNPRIRIKTHTRKDLGCIFAWLAGYCGVRKEEIDICILKEEGSNIDISDRDSWNSYCYDKHRDLKLGNIVKVSPSEPEKHMTFDI